MRTLFKNYDVSRPVPAVKHRWVRYVIAIAAVAVATLGRALLEPILGGSTPFITLFAAVAFAAWYGGRGPAWAATAFGAFAAAYFLFEPRYSFAIPRTEYQVGLAMYLIVCAFVIFVIGSMHGALKQVASQKRLYQTTLGSIGDAVIVTDAEACVAMMNATAESLTGWSLKEAQGMPLSDVFHIVNEGTRKEVESPVIKAIRAGAIVGLANHTILIAKDATEHHIDDSAAPIRNDLDEIIGVVMVFRDIGEKRQAERQLHASEMRYRRLFEAALDGILILDATTSRIVDVNRFMLELVRRDREFFIGKEMWEIGLYPDRQRNQEALGKIRTDGAVRNESVLESADGRRVPVEFISNMYEEGPRSVIQCNVRDNSERKRFAEEREAHLVNERLLRMEAETANRAKDMFLATLSHEMRTPLSAIVGWVGLLRRKECEAAELQQGLEVIDRNAKAQAQLIEDVLDVSRIVSGKLRLEVRPCDLREVIRAGIDAVKPAAEARGVAIETQFDPGADHTSGDATRLQQVVWNLLSNAVKFTPSGGKVSVTLGRERSNLRIQVADTGQGISADLIPYVFDRFRQADSSTRRKFGGLGLGLAIVKHIVEAHGGSVHAESPGEAKGSTLTVLLPIRALRVAEDLQPGLPATDTAYSRREELEARAAAEYKLVRLDGMRVLVVDDEPDALNLLARVLEEAGATVMAASSASHALELLSKMRPEVLVSDLGMPDEDGFDLIRQVRSRGLHPRDLPAVALTAFVSKEDQRAALLAGFQVHVSKPIDPHDLTAVIASLAGRTG